VLPALPLSDTNELFEQRAGRPHFGASLFPVRVFGRHLGVYTDAGGVLPTQFATESMFCDELSGTSHSVTDLVRRDRRQQVRHSKCYSLTSNRARHPFGMSLRTLGLERWCVFRSGAIEKDFAVNFASSPPNLVGKLVQMYASETGKRISRNGVLGNTTATV
jgi:hypothetical protein